MAYRNYSTAVSHIVDATGQGDFTSIQAAVTAATSGDTIVVRPGTYTENVTGKANVNISAFDTYFGYLSVTLVGKFTYTGVGQLALAGISLQTNGDYCLALTGASASVVLLVNCTVNCTDHTGIDYTSSSASSSIYLQSCSGSVSPTYTLFTHSSPGALNIQYSFIGGTSTVASTASAGEVSSIYSILGFPIATSGTATFLALHNSFENAAINSTPITIGGSGGGVSRNDVYTSGTAPSLTVNSTYSIANSQFDSTNANAINGSGTLNAGILTFTNTSSTIDGTLTVNKLTTFGGTIV